MLIGLWLSPVTCTFAEERRSIWLRTCAPSAWVAPLVAVVPETANPLAGPLLDDAEPETAEADPQLAIRVTASMIT